MRRQRPTSSERLRLLKKIDANNQLDKRRRRLYNRKFHGSFVFIATWFIRLIYLILFVIVLIFNDKSGNTRPEIVQDKKIESYTSVSRRGSAKITTLFFTTNFERYTSNIGGISIPAFGVGDTILIERNIFNKPIYFTKQGWYLKYGIDVNFICYYIVLFVSLISLGFNDGLDRFTKKLLLIILTIDIVAIFCYFFT
ncbi:MAG: hypothetical protein ACK5QC_01225 [Bacteroidota bacterium]